MDWQQRLNNALQLIESHLDKKLDMEAVAQAACCSHFHFLRMFEVITGLTAGEYVRRRRLSCAALELASGKSKVIDIALRYGYESPEAFAKAFKRLLGITPSEACKPGARLTIFPPLSVAVILKGHKQMQYRFIDQQQPIKVLGLGIRVCKAEDNYQQRIPQFWEETCKDGRYAQLAAKAGPLGVLGVCCEWDAQSETFTYLIAIEAPQDRSGLPEGLQAQELAACTYGVFESHGPIPKAILDVWERIYGEWFPQSGYEHNGNPDFEVYPIGDANSDQYYCEVWIPLRKIA